MYMPQLMLLRLPCHITLQFTDLDFAIHTRMCLLAGQYGIEKFVNDETVMQRIIDCKGGKKTFHKSMDYIYRPAKLEHMCLYQFHEETEVMLTERQAIKRNLGEWFDFMEEHPFYDAYMVVTMRLIEAVPIIPWKWTGSTRVFERPITEELTGSDPNYFAKEKYALRFMILFMPCRPTKQNNLKIDGSYTKRLQQALVALGEISEKQILRANNMQDIHNSLNSHNPENCLTLSTDLCNEDEEIDEEVREATGGDGISTDVDNWLVHSHMSIVPLPAEAVGIFPLGSTENLFISPYAFSSVSQNDSIFDYMDTSQILSDDPFSENAISQYELD